MKKIYSYSILLFLLLNFNGFSQTSIAKAEAMFIYNFSRLIQWPEAYRTGNFIIGVLGVSEIQTELAAYCTGKKVGFQDIEIKTFKSPEEISKCHIIFITNSKSNQITSVSNIVANFSTLIIAEKKDALLQGAAINFIISTSNALQFELKEDNATRYGLKLSTRLKEMASKSM